MPCGDDPEGESLAGTLPGGHRVSAGEESRDPGSEASLMAGKMMSAGSPGRHVPCPGEEMFRKEG